MTLNLSILGNDNSACAFNEFQPVGLLFDGMSISNSLKKKYVLASSH